jgi:AraC family transcriptional regulator
MQMTEIGAYGQRLGETFHLADAPAFVTRTLQMTEIAVTQIKCDAANNGLTAPLPNEDAFLVTLQVRECPEHELWIDDRPVQTAPLAAGVTCIYNLRRNPIACSISPFHGVHFYLPRSAVDAIIDIEGTGRLDDFDNNPGVGVDDPAIRGLGLSLLPAFERSEEASRIFVDHVTVAVAAHVVRAYGSGAVMSSAGSGALAPAQEIRVKELLNANLDGNIPMVRLAAECGLPTSQFSRAFQQSTGMAPHQWLLRRRVDKAKSLMRRPQLSLDDVALACGFASRRHFARVFKRAVGVNPDTWRRRDD